MAAVADHRLADDQGRTLGVGPRLADGRVHGVGVEAVHGSDDLPAVVHEEAGGLLAEARLGRARQLDVVVVVEVDELAELEGAGEARGLCGHALLQVPVGDDGVGVMVDDLVIGAVVMLGEPALGDRYPHPVGEALSQRPGGHLHAGRVPALGMAGCLRAPPA